MDDDAEQYFDNGFSDDDMGGFSNNGIGKGGYRSGVAGRGGRGAAKRGSGKNNNTKTSRNTTGKNSNTSKRNSKSKRVDTSADVVNTISADKLKKRGKRDARERKREKQVRLAMLKTKLAYARWIQFVVAQFENSAAYDCEAGPDYRSSNYDGWVQDDRAIRSDAIRSDVSADGPMDVDMAEASGGYSESKRFNISEIMMILNLELKPIVRRLK
jgi:hypothetical protein